MVWIWKSGFECKFPAPEGIMKNTKKHPTLPDHCDPTTCSKLDYKVPMERGYPYLSFGTFGSKLSSLLWPHWALIQPEANHKMKNHGVISPYPLEVPGLIFSRGIGCLQVPPSFSRRLLISPNFPFTSGPRPNGWISPKTLPKSKKLPK